MMVKVLVANADIKENSNCCQFLANDKDISIESTTNSISTLQKYFATNPNVFILDSRFNDMNYTDIIDNICINSNEKKKCNTIVTVNNPREQLLLTNTAKVYAIIKKPLDLCKLYQTVKLIIKESQIIELQESEIIVLLLSMHFHISSIGTRYLISAILHCYYYPNSLYLLARCI